MDKAFDPKNIEKKFYQTWEKTGYFKPSGKGKPYCIVIPPPNVTGSLHMGHGFQCSIMDALIRYHRMMGYNTHWQVGTDHAGIATQLVVEQQLLQENLRRQDLGREAFLKRVWQWKEISQTRIRQQMQRLGISADWQRERFTLDEGLSNAVHQVFISLFSEGLIYRGKRLANWDPVLHTAVSDLEVNFIEEDTKLWYVRYPIVGIDNHLVVATTRPETMFGDVAVAVNPLDARYQKFVGQEIHLPLTGKTIPIIADEYVDKEFGTGCVKITPAHDFNDYAVGLRHQLPIINIFTADAELNENVPAAYRGLERIKARERVVDDLEKAEFLVKTEPYRTKVPHGDRSGAILEPYLTDQWFVKTKPLAEKAIAALKNSEFRFIPENWDKTYLQWLENIEDWCVSRQLWWGHRIPAWYDETGKIYVGQSEADIRQKHKLGSTLVLTQDPDVLDTWFSSALWPFSSLGWPEKTKDLETFYPTNVLVTGFDIIFFWVARMVMMGLKFTEQVPFKDVYITGLIRDSKGQKMSKSKGNVLDPLDLVDGISLEELVLKRTKNLMLPHLAKDIEKMTRAEFPEGIPAFGVDAVRFTFCALASTSRDINFDINRLDGYRNFCNKLWNATRYVLMNVEGKDLGLDSKDIAFSSADRWINIKLQNLIQAVHKAFQDYRFDLLAEAIYDFIWHDYCDWYLEFSKPILNDKDSDESLKRGARQTLLLVLEKILRIIHPLMPFISEEIWLKVAPLLKIEGTTIMLQEYPQFASEECDENALQQITWLQKIILPLRNIRGEMNIAPNKMINLLFSKGTALDRERVEQTALYLKSLAKIATINWLAEGEKAPVSAVAISGDLELHLPLEGLIDIAVEQNRLNKEVAKLSKEQISLEQKLNNPNFINKAPKEVVASEKARLVAIRDVLAKLMRQVKMIE